MKKDTQFADSQGYLCGTKLETKSTKSGQWQPVPAACNLRPCCSLRPWQQPALTLGYISWGSVKHRTTCPPLIRQNHGFLLLLAFHVHKDNVLLPFWSEHRTWTVGQTLHQDRRRDGETFSSIPHFSLGYKTHQYMSYYPDICSNNANSYKRQFIHKN